MSILDLPSLSKKELLFHYVLDCRNRGVTLPYSDLEVLEAWTREIHDDVDALLLILSDVLPKYFSDKDKRVPLKKIQSSVSKKIREHLLTSNTLMHPSSLEIR
jgi:hypothetical protein